MLLPHLLIDFVAHIQMTEVPIYQKANMKRGKRGSLKISLEWVEVGTWFLTCDNLNVKLFLFQIAWVKRPLDVVIVYESIEGLQLF